jgi:hypothetical protein
MSLQNLRLFKRVIGRKYGIAYTEIDFGIRYRYYASIIIKGEFCLKSEVSVYRMKLSGNNTAYFSCINRRKFRHR